MLLFKDLTLEAQANVVRGINLDFFDDVIAALNNSYDLYDKDGNLLYREADLEF